MPAGTARRQVWRNTAGADHADPDNLTGRGSLDLFGVAVIRGVCGPLKIINDVQMLTTTGSHREMVPVTVNGAAELFLLDTGGFMTQVSGQHAKELKMEMSSTAPSGFTMFPGMNRAVMSLRRASSSARWSPPSSR